MKTKRIKFRGIRTKNAESLKEKITSSVILIVAISMTILGAVSCWLNFSSTYASLQQSMNQVSSIVAERVEWELQANKNIVLGMGTTMQLGSEAYTVEEKQAYIDQVVASYGFVRGKLIDLDGIARIDGTDYNEREYFQVAKTGEAYFSEPLFAKTDGAMSLIAAAPVWKDGMVNSEITGVVFVVLPVDTLNNIVASIEISENCGAYILDKNGTTVAHTTADMVTSQNNTIANAKSDSSLADIAALEQKMLDGEDGFGNYTYNGTTKFISYSPIEETDGWSVAVIAPVMDFLWDTVEGIIITVILVVIAIIAGSVMAKRLGSSIGTPIRQCVERIELLVKGDLHSEIPIFTTKDEIGMLGSATELVVTGFNKIIADIKYLLGNLSQGNFNVQSKEIESYVGDFGEILKSLNSMIDKLDVTMKQIDEGSEQVSIGAGQMAESAQSLAEGATEQAGAVEELTATIENVNNMAQESAQGAKAAYQKTVEAEEDAQAGKKSMQELVSAMENISEVSLEIQKIIGAIEDIASQTNLLSLNASIEAARAGEAGRGFAVVADQIGKLASDSAKSAVDTRELIQKALAEIENGNDITQRTVDILNGIIGSMTTFAELSGTASKSSDAQAEMLEQVQKGIEQIANVVQNNSAAAEETSATSEELSAQSENLKALVDQFQLKD